MVYKKTMRRKYSRKPKKPWYKKKYSAMEIAGQAWETAKYVKNLINVEVKKAEYTGTAVSLTAASGYIIPISAITQGDTAATRDGNSVRLKYISGNFKFNRNASATSSPCIRMVVVVDRQTIADTTPAWLDVFSQSSPLSYLNRSTVGRFSIIYDRKLTLNQTETVAKLHSFNIPTRMHIRFNGAASTDYQKNAIFVLLFCDEPTNVPTFDYQVRLGYIDN